MKAPFFIAFTAAISIIDIFVAFFSFRKGEKKGRLLGFACIFAALTSITYLFSTLWNDKMVTALFSSAYFLCVDYVLIVLLLFTRAHTKRQRRLPGKISGSLAIVYAIFETVIFAINPFTEIAVSFLERPGATDIAFFNYNQHPLFWMHLGFTYTMIAAIVVLYIIRIVSLPRQYRGQYIFVIGSILFIVALNAVYLFLPIDSALGYYDISLALYTLTALFLYIAVYNVADRMVVNRFRNDILDIIDQGIVLFDTEGSYLLKNDNFNEVLPGIDLSDSPNRAEFASRVGLEQHLEADSDGYSTQLFLEQGDSMKTIRCEFRRVKDKKSMVLGFLYCFSDASTDADLLTGFHTQAAFEKNVLAHERILVKTVACCDLNALSLLNSSQGTDAGNQAIKGLADALRKSLPAGTLFVRGKEAVLFALLPHQDEAETKELLSPIWHAYPYSFTYSFTAIRKDESVEDAMGRAEAGLRSRKLLDRDSIHSAVIGSLVKALEQTDSDTEAHVQRTGAMAKRVGDMLGLSEVEQSRLAVLSILHDIGKIGIPLEILNKPGRLNDAEFAIIRSHVEKGYAIAKSTPALESIAEDVRHHHERWDGKGYPDGLSRETIPMLCRIISVIDSFDAMTHDRVYRKALSVEEAIEELRRCAGTQFDPHVVNTFLQYLTKEGKQEIKEEKKDEKGKKAATPVFVARKETDAMHQVAYSRISTDEDGFIIKFDEEFSNIFGYTKADMKKRPIQLVSLFPEEHRVEIGCEIDRSLAQTNVAYFECPMIGKDGRDLYIFTLMRRVFDPITQQGKCEVFFNNSHETFAMQNLALKEEQKALARLEKWESTYRRDSLTGLLNHVAFQNDVELKLLSDSAIALMLMVDVDDFKDINNTKGHRKGDEVLIGVAAALRSALRKDDLACRMGGDEFAIVLYLPAECTEEEVDERARSAYAKMLATVEKEGINVTLSAGAASTKVREATFDRLYEAADQALYRAKGEGKGRLCLARPDDLL